MKIFKKRMNWKGVQIDIFRVPTRCQTLDSYRDLMNAHTTSGQTGTLILQRKELKAN